MLIWILDKPEDSSNFDRKDLRHPPSSNGKFVSQQDAINYAKPIRVPVIIFQNEDGDWEVAIDY